MAEVPAGEQLVIQRRGRYMAQVLDEFERDLEPHLPASLAGAVQGFKGTVRDRFKWFARDSIDLLDMTAQGLSQNEIARQFRDRVGER